MNRNHYSDLERSKKLKELGMPQFEGRWYESALWFRESATDDYHLVSYREYKNLIGNDSFAAVSFMEAMDAVQSGGRFNLTVPESDTVALVDKTSGKEVFRTFGPVPNGAASALAWLLENRMIEFGTR